MYRHSVCLILAGLACAALACSPKVVAGDASAGVDAVDGGVFDSLGDLADGGGEEIADAVGDGGAVAVTEDAVEVGEIADAITDASPDIDAAEVDSNGDAGDVADAIPDIPDVPLPNDCTGDALLPPPDATVVFDLGPLMAEKVVIGCGKGKPQPVAQGTACCDCPPPYSCYCNGECAWLRTPDLAVPHAHDVGAAAWTGKWVVTMTRHYIGWGPKGNVYKTSIERWNPKTDGGFLPSMEPALLEPPFQPEIPYGPAAVRVAGGKVFVGAPSSPESGQPRDYQTGVSFGPKYPSYWYDPDTDIYTPIKMPTCSKLVATANHLVCCDEGNGNIGAVYVHDVAAGAWKTVKAPPSLLPVGAKLCGGWGKVLASSDTVYFVQTTRNIDLAPWPDGTPAAAGGHVIRYHLPSGTWADLGVIPPMFLYSDFYILHKNSIVLGIFQSLANGTSYHLGQFDLSTGKTILAKAPDTFTPKAEPISLDCGVVVPISQYGPSSDSDTALGRRPMLIRDDLSVDLLPIWGFPDDGRNSPTVLATDNELLILSGYNDYDAISGYRYPLSHACKGAKP